MTVTVATETPQAAAPPASLLETWGKNERMRHIPALDWIASKVDGDLRRRIDIACSAFDQLPPHDARRPALEHEFTALCRSLDRLADSAKHGRGTQHSGTDLHARVRESINHAVTNLRMLDANLFGRRYPFQTLERSRGEQVFGSLLVAIQTVNRLLSEVRGVAADLDERLLEGLVTLQEPLRPQPIAS